MEIYWPALMMVTVQKGENPKKRGGGKKPRFNWPQIEEEAFCHFDNEGAESISHS